MLPPGRRIERYVVDAPLGEGGIAHVYRVRHVTLGTFHALKVLKMGGVTLQQRLVREGQAQAALRHPNIVAVTDVLDVDGAPGLIMEYVDGPALDQWLAERRPDFAQVEAIFRGILAGVARAHRLGLVHRDLKPANVLMEHSDDGWTPKVADFGLARVLLEGDGGARATRSGVGMGTPAYMSPEQLRDAKSVDARTDVFALGCLLYEMLSGRSPFEGPDIISVFSALAEGRYVPIERVVRDVPPHFVAVIRASLSPDRERRPADCAAVSALLDQRRVAAAPVVRRNETYAGPSVGELVLPEPESSSVAVPAPMLEESERPTRALPGAPPTMSGASLTDARSAEWGSLSGHWWTPGLSLTLAVVGAVIFGMLLVD